MWFGAENLQLARLIRLTEVQIAQNHRIIQLLRLIAEEVEPPFLAEIQLLGDSMPTPGPITLTKAGETDQTVIVGLDQFGQPFTGPMPTATYADDNPAAVTTDSNGLATAVANGTDNVTASLTTPEGLALTATLQFIADIPVSTVPVLTSITLQGQ